MDSGQMGQDLLVRVRSLEFIPGARGRPGRIISRGMIPSC